MEEGPIAALASAQHGLVTAGQCLALGLTRSALRNRVDGRRLVRLHPGVFAIPGTPVTFERRLLAATLAAGGDAVGSHEAAGLLHGVPRIGVGPIEVTTPRPVRRSIRGVSVHRTRAFLRAEHTTVRGVPVTSYARTIVDLSARLSAFQLGAALDDGLRRGVTTLEALRVCAGGLRSAPGRRMSVIHAVLAVRLPGFEPGDSDLELRFVRAVVDAGLPEPVQQHEVRLAGRVARLDLAYPSLKIAIEVDGFGPHSVRSRFDRDRARQNELVLDGWLPLRWTSSTTDERAVDEVRKAIVRRSEAA